MRRIEYAHVPDRLMLSDNPVPYKELFYFYTSECHKLK
jgi:hypothetical protein